MDAVTNQRGSTSSEKKLLASVAVDTRRLHA